MNTLNFELWPKIVSNPAFETWLPLAMRYAAGRLSDMTGHSLKVDNLWVEVVPLDELILDTSDPEIETVGVYLSIGDDLPGEALLMLSLDDALYLADWLLLARPHTATKLGQLESSALSEAGNLLLSAFLSALAEFTQTPLRPSPPAIVVDMLATILQTMAASMETVTDELLIIKASFKDIYDTIFLRFWVLPDPSVLQTLDRDQTLKVLKTFRV